MEGKPERLSELHGTTKRRALTEELLHDSVKLRTVTGILALGARETPKLQVNYFVFNTLIRGACNIIKHYKH